MVESTALEMRRAREGTQGSNPCLSAIHHTPASQLCVRDRFREGLATLAGLIVSNGLTNSVLGSNLAGNARQVVAQLILSGQVAGA